MDKGLTTFDKMMYSSVPDGMNSGKQNKNAAPVEDYNSGINRNGSGARHSR